MEFATAVAPRLVLAGGATDAPPLAGGATDAPPVGREDAPDAL
ncbi:MAG TPA: hypothetical protein VMU39_22425 [Solirubrobacteraceae bacterium]|nr:hypothetical protein [Solirubrobacteraceae bacterium]